MDYKFVLYEKVDSIAKITVNRPEVMNAQSRRVLEEVDDAFTQAEDDDEVRVVIVAGAGDNFSAGHDLGSKEMLEDFLKKYCAGLKMPLYFFPRSSWDYAFTLLDKGKPREYALEMARSTWTGSDYALGDCEDAYYRLCFKNTDPLDS